MDTPRKERILVGLISFAAVYVFFFEYLWPVRRVHLFSDIEGFHWPLLSYAWQSLRAGRFPEWDPGIYCGISFAGNPQAALFYPPNWLLFALTWPRTAISYVTLEFSDALHFWAALLLMYGWQRERGGTLLAALVSGLCFAFSGYVLGDIQHLGATNAYTWFPLALWGADQASRRAGWRPLWKLLVASALAFLAGYPPAWAVMAACTLMYALCLPNRRWLVPATLGTLLLSLGLCAIQLLPVLEASSLKVAAKYYSGSLPWVLFSNLFLPNRFDQSRAVPMGLGEEQYLYIGVAGLFALVWLVLYRRWRLALPALAIAALSLWMMRNPFGWTEAVLDGLPRFNEIVRNWNFLAGLALASAMLAGAAVEDILRRPAALSVKVRHRALAASAAWCVWLWYVWIPGGRDFGVGWKSAIEVAVTLAIFAGLLGALRSESRPRVHAVLSVALLLLVFTEFKVYGTNRRFSAAEEDVDRFFAADARVGGEGMIGVANEVYQEFRRNRHYRIALVDSLVHDDMRHYMLSTPQGLDPMLPDQYRREVERLTPFQTDREFPIDPRREEVLRQFGVRYILVSPGQPVYEALRNDARFRLMEPASSYYKAFEYLAAEPAYRFDGKAECVRWLAEDRQIEVESPGGGTLVLKEQFATGWSVFIDGIRAPLERYSLAFQQVRVPGGRHRVQFTYRSPALRQGAWISLLCLLACSGALIMKR